LRADRNAARQGVQFRHRPAGHLGERLWRQDLLREALQAIRQAQAVYADAGLRQYDANFAAWIEGLEATIRAMGKD
jgi:hypothetical protein